MSTELYEYAARDPFALSVEEISRLAGRRIVERGVDYALRGRVVELAAAGGRMEAKVEGTAGEPYIVTILDDGDGGLVPECTCPFDWEPFCKHAVAALARHSGIGEGEWREARERLLPQEPEELERHVREQRGQKDGFRVRRLRDEPGALRFEVVSPPPADVKRDPRTYEVEIRSLSRRLNLCSCLDFERSMLGTCKHIEAVLFRIRLAPPARRRAFLSVLEKNVQVVLGREGGPKIVVLLSGGAVAEGLAAMGRRQRGKAAGLLGRHFDAAGALRGDPVRVLPLLEACEGIRVARDVREFVGRIALDRARRARRGEIRAELVSSGAAVAGAGGALYPYQLEGVSFLAAVGRGLLADDMGLGKTVQAIAAAHVLKRRGEARKVLVVCPASLKRQWADEIGKFTSYDAAVVSGGRARRAALYREDHDFTIANYEVVARDTESVAAGGFDLLVIDEAQRLKNWRTKTAEAIKSIRTEHAFVLTGTPLENRLDDLYSIMQVVDDRVLGPLWAFNEKFIELVRDEGQRKTIYKNLGELRRRLRPVMLRRDRGEVLTQLPERVVNRYYVPVMKTQMEIMLEAEANAARLASIAHRRPLTSDELKRLLLNLQIARMACNAARLVDPAHPDEAPKLDEFSRIVEEVCVEGGRKAVVFSQWEIFQRMAAERAKALGVRFVRLHGGVPSDKRGDLIARFRDDPDCRIFFSTDAGGVGLNLQCASVVVNLDLPWNPAVLEQRIGRVHRMGQRETVNVLLVISENSFEHKMEKLLAGKRDLFDAAILPDSMQESVTVPSMCLAVAQALFAGIDVDEETDLEAIQEELGKMYEAQEEGPGEAGTGAGGEEGLRVPELPVGGEAPLLEPGVGGDPEPAVAVSAEVVAADHAADSGGDAGGIGGILGDRLRRTLRLPSGRVVGVVDRLDEVTEEAGRRLGVPLLDEKTVGALAMLEADSPLAGAVVVEERGGDGAAGDGEAQKRREVERRREELADVAGRKLKAAESMAAAGFGAEALSTACAALEAAMRARGAHLGREGKGLAGMLYEVLLPEELVTIEEAGLASRAESVARAYADTSVAPPERLVSAVLEDVSGIVGSMSR